MMKKFNEIQHNEVNNHDLKDNNNCPYVYQKLISGIFFLISYTYYYIISQ